MNKGRSIAPPASDSESDKRKQGKRASSRRSPTPQKGGNKSRRVYDDETFYSDGDSSSFDDTYYHTEYDGESQWTEGETYFTRDTRRTRRHHGRRRRDSESSLSDSGSDYSSSYYSDDSYDTRTYSDSTWRSMDDETRYTKYMQRRGGYDDETMYTREQKRRTNKAGGRR